MYVQSALETKKSKGKVIIPVLIIAAIVVGVTLSTLVGIMYSIVSKYDSKIYPEVWIEDINVSGKTKEEAMKAIIQKHDNLIANKTFIIKANNKQYQLDASKFDMKCNYDEVIDKAYEIGRRDNIFKKYLSIKYPDKKVFELQHTFNYDSADPTIKIIEQENNEQAVNATISKTDSEKFTIGKEKYGYELNSQKLKQDIIDKLNNIENEQNLVVEADIKKIDPKIKEEDLKNINSKISSFTTSFKTSNDNRSTNISVASNAINGTLLMPNDTFSFNDVVGERSAERGYKIAKVIINKKLEDDLGGGVCQVSTTLYNAILRANISSVERHHHSIPSSYVGLGLDATVAYGLLDYKFKNTLPYPIYIESVIKDKNLTFNIYSSSSLNNKTYDIVNEVEGNKVKVYRITYEQGKLVSKKLLYTDKIEKSN